MELASWRVRKKLLNEMACEYMHGEGEFDDMLHNVTDNLCVTEKKREYLERKVGGRWKKS